MKYKYQHLVIDKKDLLPVGTYSPYWRKEVADKFAMMGYDGYALVSSNELPDDKISFIFMKADSANVTKDASAMADTMFNYVLPELKKFS